MAQIHFTRLSSWTIQQYKLVAITRPYSPFAVFCPSIPLTTSISHLLHLLSDSSLRLFCVPSAQMGTPALILSHPAHHTAFGMAPSSVGWALLSHENIGLTSGRSPRKAKRFDVLDFSTRTNLFPIRTNNPSSTTASSIKIREQNQTPARPIHQHYHTSA